MKDYINRINGSIEDYQDTITQNSYLANPLSHVAVFAIVFAILPLLIGRETLLGIIVAFGTFAMAYNLLLGYTGLVSFGHAAFFGVGSYVFIFSINAGYSLILTLGVVLIVAGLLGAAFGYIALKRRGLYFAMITLALAQGIYGYIFASGFTGGDDGLLLQTREIALIPGFLLDFTQLLNAYYFILAIAVITMIIIYRIVHSPFGLTLKSIRENEERAEHLGYNVQFCLLNAFVISAAFSGIAGAMLISIIGITSPENVHWLTSGEVLVMALLGGIHTFIGPFVGAVVFYVLSELFLALTDTFQLFLGAALLVVVLFFPEGIVGRLRKVFDQ